MSAGGKARDGGRKGLVACLVAAAVIGCGAASAAEGDMIEQGKAIVERNCAGCHAVGPAGDSPLAAAPPFRILHRRYPVEDLQEALAEGISTGHPAMPEFVFGPDDVAAIITYLKSLSP